MRPTPSSLPRHLHIALALALGLPVAAFLGSCGAGSGDRPDPDAALGMAAAALRVGEDYEAASAVIDEAAQSDGPDEEAIAAMRKKTREDHDARLADLVKSWSGEGWRVGAILVLRGQTQVVLAYPGPETVQGSRDPIETGSLEVELPTGAFPYVIVGELGHDPAVAYGIDLESGGDERTGMVVLVSTAAD